MTEMYNKFRILVLFIPDLLSESFNDIKNI